MPSGPGAFKWWFISQLHRFPHPYWHCKHIIIHLTYVSRQWNCLLQPNRPICFQSLVELITGYIGYPFLILMPVPCSFRILRWCSIISWLWPVFENIITLISKLKPCFPCSLSLMDFLFNTGSVQLIPWRINLRPNNSIRRIFHNVILLNVQFLLELICIMIELL